MPRLARLAAAALLLAPTGARAWGPDGHHIVCEIAWQNLGRETRAQIVELLRGDEDSTFFRSCSWADRELRARDPSFDPIHYANVPRGAEEVRGCAAPCVLSGIEEYSAVLRDPSAPRSRRLFALKLVGHLVGDVHQPLHVAYRDDRGGNDVRVQFAGERSNLHRLWDSGLLDAMAPDWRALARELASQVDPADRAAWSRDAPLDWASESYALVRSSLYPAGPSITDEYARRSRPIVRRRLQAAGIRLAALLERSLSPDGARDVPLDAPIRSRFSLWRWLRQLFH